MKKKITILILTMLPFLQMQALDFIVENFKYFAEDRGTEAILTGYVNKPTGRLAIPSDVVHNGVHYRVAAIGSEAFAGCRGLTDLYIPSTLTAIGDRAFFSCNGITGTLIISKSVTVIGERAFSDCSGLTDVIISKSVISIGEGVFLNCTGLTGIKVDSNNQNYSAVDGILYNKAQTTLHTCPSGKKGSITIPSSVTTIGNSAFYYCIGLRGALNIPSSVTYIGSDAFSNCNGFVSLTIPASVNTIGSFAFLGCNSLTTVVNYRSTPLAIDPNTFSGLPEGSVLKVPIGSKAAYQDAEGWAMFIIEEFNPVSVETIEGEAKRFWIEGNHIRLSNSEAVLGIELYNAHGQLIGRTTTVPDSLRGILIVKLFYRDGSVSNSKVVRE